MCRVVLERLEMVNVLEKIMNCRTPPPTMKPVLLLPMFIGIIACSCLHGDSKYIDMLEKSLYNGLISGVGMDGKSFFYTNAMEIKNRISRTRIWRLHVQVGFHVPAVPTNVTRLIPSIPGYMYAQKDNNIYVNLFVPVARTIKVNKKTVQLKQQNNYPWDGNLVFNVTPKSPVALNLLIRIPGWAQNEAMPSDLYKFETNSAAKTTIRINGKPVDYTMENGYAVLNKTWKKGDVVEVNLPMEIRRVVANDKVADDMEKLRFNAVP